MISLANSAFRIGLAMAAALAALHVTTGASAQTFQEFNIPTANSTASHMAAGADGAVWFNELDPNKIARATVDGITEFALPSPGSGIFDVAPGPDGTVWFSAPSNGKLGRITPAGVIAEFSVPSQPHAVAVGADGNIWYSANFSNKIGRVSPAGAPLNEYNIPSADAQPLSLRLGPDGNLWFTEYNKNQIGRITPAGAITEFAIPTPNSHPKRIVAGPDGAMWFTEATGSKIGRITMAGVVTEFPLPAPTGFPDAITLGPDGALWFTADSNKIGRITPAGQITLFDTPSAQGFPNGMATSNDGAIWFLETSNNIVNKIVRMVPPAATSKLLAATLPASRSVKTTTVASAFATIVNTGPAATNCGITPISSVPGPFNFQTTDSATNALTGTPNTRVSIGAGASQSFVFSYTAGGPLAPVDALFAFGCAGVDAVVPVVGLNSLRLTFDANPVPDMIAVGLTPSNDGYAHMTTNGGTGLFVIATANIGAAGTLTARVRLSNSSLPVTALVCETNPQTAVCKAPPSATVTRSVATNENATWAAFLTATGTVNSDPAKSRAFFEFVDAGGVVRGSTSTAVTTQ